ncbi:MAG: GAF domain-containing SpoIIE family protein phosphatase [Thermodesulfobacteriota bacterium]|nr:GAF domain-containing SpoIIE family protein phosphatase [Thermodesulfobacteriota bacterium]
MAEPRGIKMTRQERRKQGRRKHDRGKVGRLKKLIEASEVLASVESVEELLPILLQMAQDVTRATASSILLYDPKRDVLKFSLAMNEAKDGVQEILKSQVELKMGQGIAGWVAQNRESVLIRDAECDNRFFRPADKATGFKTESLLCVPIIHGEELLGVVQVLNAKNRSCFSPEDLELLESFAHLACVAIVRRKLLEIRVREQSMLSQLDAASHIQTHFLPDNPDPGHGSGIWGHTTPAVYVGGDLYDFIPLSDGSWIICVADVSGKGLPAALVMVAMWAKLQGLTQAGMDPGILLEALNRDLVGVMAGEIFATAVMARYWPDSGRAEVALAGHLPPLLLKSGEVEVVQGLKGIPLGIEPSTTYTPRKLKLKKGESLLFITDGVTEARNRTRNFFEMQGVIDFVRTHPGPPWGKILLEKIDRFRDGVQANDDTTLVEVWRS